MGTCISLKRPSRSIVALHLKTIPWSVSSRPKDLWVKCANVVAGAGSSVKAMLHHFKQIVHWPPVCRRLEVVREDNIAANQPIKRSSWVEGAIRGYLAKKRHRPIGANNLVVSYGKPFATSLKRHA